MMTASDHHKNRDALNQSPSKKGCQLFKSWQPFFDGFDFLLARLHPFYKMPNVQRAMKDELHKVAEIIT